MPEYKRASYSGESLELNNGTVKVAVHKRISGWGFAEIFNDEAKLMAVLDHFGELKLRDQDIPMRLEADKYEKTEKDTDSLFHHVHRLKGLRVLRLNHGSGIRSSIPFCQARSICRCTATRS